MIVETEAYLGIEDKAAHSYNNRRTKRTETMFAVGGTVYIFFIYGMYFQFNVVVGENRRAARNFNSRRRTLENIEIMRERRGTMKDTNLTSGPGKLCIALGIDQNFNCKDLLGNKVWIEDAKEVSEAKIVAGKRVGIDYAEEYAEKPWRFWLKDNQFVSRK